MATVNSRYNADGKIANILLYSIQQFKEELFNIYQVKDKENIPVVSGSGSDINRELGRTQKNISYQKYFTIIPASVEEATDSYNSFASKKYSNGLMPNKTEDPDYYYKFSLTPVICTLNLSFFAQSFADIIEFSDYWISNKREGTFQLCLADLKIDIRVDTEPTVSFSDKDLSNGDFYKVDTIVKLSTYVGSIYKTSAIKQIVESVNLLDIKDNVVLEERYEKDGGIN